MLGHDHLQRVARAQRAEYWRLLYVALTRARDHIVVPLPRQVADERQPRDRWLETIRSGLAFDGSVRSGTYARTLSGPDGPRAFQVGVTDVTFDAAAQSAGPATREAQPAPTDAVASHDPSSLAPFVPLHIRPSTVEPHAAAPDRWLIDHLRTEELHTAAAP